MLSILALSPAAEMVLFWGGFHLLIGFLLVLDLGVFHKKDAPVSTKEALGWSSFWICLSLLFNLILFYFKGPEIGLQFLTGYLIEKSLSVDNIFIFALIFSYFQVPKQYQYKVLYWGILGAIFMRLCMILAGVALLEQFHWMIYAFGVIICISGIRLLFQKEKKLDPEKNILVRIFTKFFPVAHDYDRGNFFVRRKGILYITPLLIAHLIIESADVVFALDSIPAIFAVTSDPFVVYTSNIFAILGLRSLYFLLANSLEKFHVLKYGLALILVFIGIKMVLDDFYDIPTAVALSTVLVILGSSFLLSYIIPNKNKMKPPV